MSDEKKMTAGRRDFLRKVGIGTIGAGATLATPLIAPAQADSAQADRRLPNTTLFALSGIKAETALIAMDLAGFAVSSGSACSSGKVAASHVLKAMGVADDLAACALRLSVGPATTRADVDAFLQAWSRHLANLSSKEKRGIAA